MFVIVCLWSAIGAGIGVQVVLCVRQAALALTRVRKGQGIRGSRAGQNACARLRSNRQARAQSRENLAMATYIVLANFTEQGIRNVKDSPQRADAFKDMAKKTGATVKDVFWTLGQYDAVAIVEAPDDAPATALGLSVAKLGNIRTQTLRAFSAADMKNILGKVS